MCRHVYVCVCVYTHTPNHASPQCPPKATSGGKETIMHNASKSRVTKPNGKGDNLGEENLHAHSKGDCYSNPNNQSHAKPLAWCCRLSLLLKRSWKFKYYPSLKMLVLIQSS